MQRTDLRLEIPDMKCRGCVDRIETMLGRVEGVRSVSVDLEEKQALVTYDGEATTPEALLEVVEKGGYSPTRA